MSVAPRPARPSAVIGIDLGTTHTALAWAAPEPSPALRQLSIPQWVAGRRREGLEQLPSVAYAPMPGELPELEDEARDWVVGQYAETRARETVGRGITSAKSWLCHAGVDRTGPILPWASGELEGASKLSPVEVSRRILAHVRRAFERAEPGIELRSARVVLTVPASFDPTARKLTVLAAEQAGLSVQLLEEPQAAFYEYLGHAAAELEAVVARRGALQVLVCDVGGGTMDLSLIDVSPAGDRLGFRRSAVGRHLLLGGDNMDLALARHAEAKLGEPLEPERFGQLLLAARSAKEALLGPDPPDSYPIRLLGSGAELLGHARSIDVSRAEVEALVLDGFFPLTERGELPLVRRSALTTFGLPYERDPAVTRHVWQFLERHTGGRVPAALLLNGGVARSPAIAERLARCLRGFGDAEPELLSIPHPELSVCRGAVRYGLSASGFGPRIEGGAAQGYYVAVEGAGEPGRRRGLCVVPRGAREGERHVLGTRRFAVTLGRPARFELYASDTALDAPGNSVELDASYQQLPPVTAELRLDGAAPGTQAEVQLEGELSAVGTLELGCTVLSAPEGPASTRRTELPRLSLAFELGARAASDSGAPTEGPPLSVMPPSGRGRRGPELGAAEEAMQRVFGKGRKDVTLREVKDLPRTLERALGPREGWTLELARALADVLLGGAKGRQRSEDHERVFWMLSGYCLRPGFGHALDPERIARLWPLFEAGLGYRESERSWQQYWIAWRRVAGGLDEDMQRRVRELLDPVIAPPELKLKKAKGFRPGAPDELLSLASHLERAGAEARAALGGWILDRTWSDRDPRLWTYLGRLGARVPSYASAHMALRGSLVERWVEQLLREQWDKVPTAAWSAVSLSRLTGDQARDLQPALRQRVAAALGRVGAPEAYQRAVLELVAVSQAERQQHLGDDLPLGLRLIE